MDEPTMSTVPVLEDTAVAETITETPTAILLEVPTLSSTTEATNTSESSTESTASITNDTVTPPSSTLAELHEDSSDAANLTTAPIDLSRTSVVEKSEATTDTDIMAT